MNTDYCKFCFQKEGFTSPDMSVDEKVLSYLDPKTKRLALSEEALKNL